MAASRFVGRAFQGVKPGAATKLKMLAPALTVPVVCLEVNEVPQMLAGFAPDVETKQFTGNFLNERDVSAFRCRNRIRPFNVLKGTMLSNKNGTE